MKKCIKLVLTNSLSLYELKLRLECRLVQVSVTISAADISHDSACLEYSASLNSPCFK